ncbi:MAG TPA: hypothetical protein VKI20_09450, partial [Acidimicrobiales bacterium]|nr:hypothetical protein [Acidimicrobiales bacterium]
PGSTSALMQEMGQAKGLDPRLDSAIDVAEQKLAHLLAKEEEAEYLARAAVEQLALALQGSLVVRHSPSFVAEAFLASRLDGGAGGKVFGTLPSGIDCAAIIDRHRPKLP